MERLPRSEVALVSRFRHEVDLLAESGHDGQRQAHPEGYLRVKPLQFLIAEVEASGYWNTGIHTITLFVTLCTPTLPAPLNRAKPVNNTRATMRVRRYLGVRHMAYQTGRNLINGK